MTILAGKDVALRIGDGGTPSETFDTLKGATLTRLEVTQRLIDNPAIASDGWAMGAACSKRRLAMDVQAMAYDHAATDRLRAAALSGAGVNFQLALSGSESWEGSAMVTHYQENATAGDAKRITLRMESVTSVSPA